MIRRLNDPDLDSADRQILEDIAEFDLHIVLVPQEDDTPGWAFTVGLFERLGHPEIIVFGLRDELVHAVLNGLADDIRNGQIFMSDDGYPNVLENVLCAFRPVHPRWYEWFVGTASWYYEAEDFPLIQLIWPDKEQHYPWEDGFTEDWLWAQPLLFHEDVDAARAGDLLATMDE